MQKQEEPSPIHADHAKEYEEHYDLPHISLKTLEAATDNFSKSNKLGEGGYGSVYRVTREIHFGLIRPPVIHRRRQKATSVLRKWSI